MKKIILTESQLYGIVKESVQNLLYEGPSQLLYHFIEPKYLTSLLRRNSFKTSKPEKYCGDGEMCYIDGKGRRFISFTRNRNHKEGYPVIMLDGMNHVVFNTIISRMTIDGDALKTYSNFKDRNGKQHNLKVKPMDWAYYDNNKGDIFSFMDNFGVDARNGKEWMMKSDNWSENTHWLEDGCSSMDCDGRISDLYSHPYSQAEDRLTTDATYIPDANKYIKCIDIYVRENKNKYPDDGDMISDEDFKYMGSIKRYCEKLAIPIYFYNNQVAFTKQIIWKSISFEEIVSTHKKYIETLM